jgi:hypothetical protein
MYYKNELKQIAVRSLEIEKSKKKNLYYGELLVCLLWRRGG